MLRADIRSLPINHTITQNVNILQKQQRLHTRMAKFNQTAQHFMSDLDADVTFSHQDDPAFCLEEKGETLNDEDAEEDGYEDSPNESIPEDLTLWMSRAKLATPQNTRNPGVTKLAQRQSYSQAVQTRKLTHDPEKQARDGGKMSHDSSRDPPVSLTSRDLSRDHTRSHDPTRFRRVPHPLINTWQTVGTNQRINERVGIPPTKRNPQRDSPLALKSIEPVRSNAQYCAAAIGTPPYS